MKESELASKITLVANVLMQADGLIITAGAGFGVDSGLPDFRGNDGFWNAYPALAKSKLDFTQMANPLAFSSFPERAWGFYGHRLNLYRQTKPHDGFQILKRIGEKLKNKYQIFTSNVDGHFQVAGFESERIVECHGSINHTQCSVPCNQNIVSADELVVVTDDINCLAISKLPECSFCGKVSRPNILMFGDFNWLSHRTDKQYLNMEKYLSMMQSPVIIECGAGLSVPTVRYFSESQQGTLVRINPRESQISLPKSAKIKQTISISNGALIALKQLEEELEDRSYFSL